MKNRNTEIAEEECSSLALRIQVVTVSEVKPSGGFMKPLNISLSIFVNHLSGLEKKEPVKLFCFPGLNDVGVSERRYGTPQISSSVCVHSERGHVNQLIC